MITGGLGSWRALARCVVIGNLFHRDNDADTVAEAPEFDGGIVFDSHELD